MSFYISIWGYKKNPTLKESDFVFYLKLSYFKVLGQT